MKKFLIYVCVAAILIGGIAASVSMGKMAPTYDGRKAAVSVYELRENEGEGYDISGADGAAAVIIQKNLSETHAENDVTSIVFDWRGYDTMGEAFIMMLTISGIIVLLRKTEAQKKATLEAIRAKKYREIAEPGEFEVYDKDGGM